MKKLFGFVLLGLLTVAGWGQVQHTFPALDTTNIFTAPQTAPTYNAVTGFQVNGAAPAGHVARGNGTNYVDGQLACGDLSNGAPSCSTDATNANNISSGTLPAARLPNPTASTLGGTESIAAIAHQWVNSISTLGVPSLSQPACGDLSNGAPSCSIDTTNAANISSGTLPAARLPNPSASTLGGVESIAAVAHNFVTSISTSGVPAQAQPACGDLSNAAASCSTDATNASNISSGTLAAARMNPSVSAHTYLGNNTGSTAAAAFVQPAAADLSNGVTGSGAVVLATSPSLTTPSLSSPSTTGTDSGTATEQNKWIQPRIVTMADSTSITPTAGTADQNIFSSSQAAGTLTVNAPSGSPVDGQKLVLRLKATNAQTYSFAATYHFSTSVAAPTTLAAGKTDYIGLIFNAAASVWDVVAVDQGHTD